MYINVTPFHPLGHRQLLLRNKCLVEVVLKSESPLIVFTSPWLVV